MDQEASPNGQDPAPESSDCPNSGRDAYPTGATQVTDRRYELMKCSRCFDSLWLSGGP